MSRFIDKRMGTIGQIGLLFIFLPMMMYFISFIPGGADFIHNLFWETLGIFEIFEGAASAMSSFLISEEIQFDNMVRQFFKSISESFLQAWIIGICVTICVEICTKQEISKRWEKGTNVKYAVLSNGFIGSPVLLSAIGVFVGVLILTLIKKADSETKQAVLYGAIAIGLMLTGIGIMLGKRKKYSEYTTGRIVGNLLKTLGGAAYAFCVAGAVAALMNAPLMIQNGASIWHAVLWYFVMVVFMFLMILIYRVFD
ncbi:MAG: hypothetical protein IKJ51_11445 [Clostridia bacterium]|nr:hypothetical protein [Clostridia bacterium]